MSQTDRTDEFVQLLSQHSRWIYAYILTIVPNKADADDIYQTTSATLWRKFGEFEPGSNFRAWSFRVAYFEAVQYRRRNKNLPACFGDAFVELVDESLAERVGALDDIAWALELCLGKLSESDRKLIRQRYQAGAKVDSMAAALGRSVGTVYRQLSRVHKALYQCIQARMSQGGTREPA